MVNKKFTDYLILNNKIVDTKIMNVNLKINFQRLNKHHFLTENLHLELIILKKEEINWKILDT